MREMAAAQCHLEAPPKEHSHLAVKVEEKLRWEMPEDKQD